MALTVSEPNQHTTFDIESRVIPRTPIPNINSYQGKVAIDKTMSTAANLVKLLPSNTIFAFQALSPSFSNRGQCHIANMYLTMFLITISAVSCCFFSLTDSLMGPNGKLYYGIATRKGLYIFNCESHEEEWLDDQWLSRLERYKITWVDYLHGFFSILLFMTLAFNDSDIQHCFFPDSGPNTKAMLVNLPLGAAFLSSIVFMIFPTSRKSIGYSDMASHSR